MDMNLFFNFQSQLLSSTFRAPPVNLRAGEEQSYLLITGDYKNIDFPVIFKQTYGKKMRDLLDTEYPNLYLISDRLQSVLEENGLTGWKIFPTKLFDKKGNEIFGYHGLSIVGRSGPTSYDNCEIFEKRYVPNGPVCKLYKGVYIDEWDGSDFFIPDGTISIFITKKAADVLKKNKITNLWLTNLTDEETDVSDVLRKNS